MNFLNYDSSASIDEIKACWKSYTEYLEGVKYLLPLKAREFALAEWHFDKNDSRAPHDSWLEEFAIGETSETPGSSKRDIFIKARFLGAYHDGFFTISYKDVRKYSLEKNLFMKGRIGNGHGDWLIDEIRCADDGLIVHEIEFGNNSRWLIYCKDIEYNWTPTQNPKKNE